MAAYLQQEKISHCSVIAVIFFSPIRTIYLQSVSCSSGLLVLLVFWLYPYIKLGWQVSRVILQLNH